MIHYIFYITLYENCEQVNGKKCPNFCILFLCCKVIISLLKGFFFISDDTYTYTFNSTISRYYDTGPSICLTSSLFSEAHTNYCMRASSDTHCHATITLYPPGDLIPFTLTMQPERNLYDSVVESCQQLIFEIVRSCVRVHEVVWVFATLQQHLFHRS